MHFKLWLQVRIVICNIFNKSSHKNNRMFYDFLQRKKNQFLLIFYTKKMTISQFLRACSHQNVIVRSYINGWYLFWHQWKEDVHTYTLVLNLGNLGLYDLQY